MSPLRLAAVLVLAAAPASAATLVLPDAIRLAQPSGAAADTRGPHTDDVLLDELTFGATVVRGDAGLRSVARAQVLEGRGNVNAEWGDDDDGADGDPDPFTALGFSPSAQETTDPSRQDATLAAAFAGRSLTEMTDGESGAFSYRVAFTAGLSDNAPGVADAVPELVLVERGMNDSFWLALITGGSFDAPVLSAPLLIDSRDFWASGVLVDTREIGGAQELGIAGLDLDAFGLAAGEMAYGFELRRASGGPDMSGFFLASDDPARFSRGLPGAAVSVPLPGALVCLGSALLLLSWRRFRGLALSGA